MKLPTLKSIKSKLDKAKKEALKDVDAQARREGYWG